METLSPRAAGQHHSILLTGDPGINQQESVVNVPLFGPVLTTVGFAVRSYCLFLKSLPRLIGSSITFPEEIKPLCCYPYT